MSKRDLMSGTFFASRDWGLTLWCVVALNLWFRLKSKFINSAGTFKRI